MLRKLFLLIIILIFSVAPLNAAEVKNENVRQVGNRILFEFDVEDNPGEDTEVTLVLTINGQKYTWVWTSELDGLYAWAFDFGLDYEDSHVRDSNIFHTRVLAVRSKR